MVIVPKSTLRKHHTNRFKNAEDAVTDRNNWFRAIVKFWKDKKTQKYRDNFSFVLRVHPSLSRFLRVKF